MPYGQAPRQRAGAAGHERRGPAAILFIDDINRNVAAARAARLTAQRWPLDEGHDTPHALLARHGVTVAREGPAGSSP